MDKRGQVSGFIIIGIVIVLIAVLLVYLGDFKGVKKVSLDRFSPVEVFIQDCLDKSVKETVLHNMKQGGYNNVYFDNIDMGDFKVPYYIIDGVIIVPDKEIIEDELALGLDNVDECLDFSGFKEFNFEKGENRFNVSVMDKKIIIDARIPVKASFNDVTRNFDDFKTIVDVDLMRLFDASLEYVKLQEEDVNATFIGGLGDIAFERDLDFEIINIDDEVVYSFSDGMLDGEKLVLMFGVGK